jgi:hypothetical protein
MLERLDRSEGSVVGLRVAGKVTSEDYDRIVPELKRTIAEHGEIDLLCRFEGWSGMEPEAVWRDMKFYAKHFGDVRRLAVVKDRDWQGTLANALGPLTGMETRVFEQSDEEDAWNWLFRKAREDQAWKDEDAGPRHARKHRKKIRALIEEMREDGEKVEDPRARALFETTAEVLGGLSKALRHYERKSEPAWQEERERV